MIVETGRAFHLYHRESIASSVLVEVSNAQQITKTVVFREQSTLEAKSLGAFFLQEEEGRGSARKGTKQQHKRGRQ
jgi:hypothetical protein